MGIWNIKAHVLVKMEYWLERQKNVFMIKMEHWKRE